MRPPRQLLMRLVAAAALTAAWPLFSAPAYAQAPAPSPQAPSAPAPSPGTPQQQQTPDIPDQKLDAAAVALEQVANVREKYRQRLEEAPAADAKTIADEAKNAIYKAITDQGLSIEEYTSILVVAQNDPAIREKITQRLRHLDK
jgi:uncharacterized protein DUF4168